MRADTVVIMRCAHEVQGLGISPCRAGHHQQQQGKDVTVQHGQFSVVFMVINL